MGFILGQLDYNKAVNADAFSFASLTTNASVTAGVQAVEKYLKPTPPLNSYCKINASPAGRFVFGQLS
jgi:hypothetical protein